MYIDISEDVVIDLSYASTDDIEVHIENGRVQFSGVVRVYDYDITHYCDGDDVCDVSSLDVLALYRTLDNAEQDEFRESADLIQRPSTIPINASSLVEAAKHSNITLEDMLREWLS